jgi:hypothetical protein
MLSSSRGSGLLRLLLAALACIALNNVSLLPCAQAVDIPRWAYVGQTASQVTQLINDKNARLTEIRVQDPSVPTFAITMVQNTDDFASGWWWYYGVDAGTISSLLSNRRLISIDPYWTPHGLRFAVVMVPNDGAQARSWWWYYGVDMTTVGKYLSQNNARLVALRPYNDNGKKFAVIMISNTGKDDRYWEWWVGVSPNFIAGRLGTRLRVASFNPDPFGNWDAILVQRSNEAWWWWYGLNPAQILSNLNSHATRLVDISPYRSNGDWRYSIVELGNSNPPQGGFEI